MVTTEFTEDADKFIGWAETAAGLGLTVGPVIGSLLYQLTNYQWTFVIYGLFLFLAMLIMMAILPSCSVKDLRRMELL